MKTKFDAQAELDRIIKWLTNYKISTDCGGVVLGLSGGKDSTVVAMLAKKVFPNNVLAMLLPNGTQSDIEDSINIANTLNLTYEIRNIETIYQEMIKDQQYHLSDKVKYSIPPRIRMMCLYTKAHILGWRVIGTSNASEGYLGWATKHGDTAYDVNPILHLTKSEVVEIGKILAKEFNLPEKYIVKDPADGLTMRSDEENFGFPYQVLDHYMRTGICPDPVIKQKIDQMHSYSEHKRRLPYSLLDRTKLSLNELATQLKVSRPTIYNWIKEGAPFEKEGEKMHFYLDDIQCWLRTRKGF